MQLPKEIFLNTVNLLEAVDQKRKDKKLSWRQFGEEIGVSSGTFIHNRERIHSSNIGLSSDTLIRLAIWLNINVLDFVEGIDAQEKTSIQTQLIQVINKDHQLSQKSKSLLINQTISLRKFLLQEDQEIT